MSYYTAFLYEGYSPSRLHCTHKYLGFLDSAQLAEVLQILEKEFTERPFSPFLEKFAMEDWFGPNRAIRVLKAEGWNDFDFRLGLREALNRFRTDDYDYSPHVTTLELNKVEEPFSSFALVCRGQIIREWK